MAIIPQVIRDRLMGSAVQGTPGINPAPEQIGQAVGEGVTETAGAGFDIAIKEQNLRNEGEVNNAMVGHETTTLDAFEKMKQQYAGNPDAMVPALNKFMADDLQQRQKNASNPFTKLMMEQEPPFFVRSMIAQAHEWAYKQGHDNMVNQSTQVINGLSNQAMNLGRDPHSNPDDMLRNAAPLFDVLGKQAGSITGSAHQEWADEITSKGGLAIAKSMFDGAMETQPAKAFLLSQNPEFAKMFSSPQEAKNLQDMQQRAYAAIGGSVIKDKNTEIKNDILNNQQMVQDVLSGKAGYSVIDAAQRRNANPQLNDSFYNYLKDISLNVTSGVENNQATKDAFKSSFIDEANKLGFSLPGQFASLDASKDFLNPKIDPKIEDLYKFRDDLLSARARNIISDAEYKTYNKQLAAPLMAATLANHDPDWFTMQLHHSQLTADQSGISGQNKGWLATTDISKVDDFRSAYNVMERGIKLRGVDEGSPEYQQLKVATYDAYFKETERLNNMNPPQLNPFTQKPYTPVDIAHAVLGESIGDVKIVKGVPYKVAGYDPKDGMPLYDTPKEWQAMLEAKQLKDIR